MNRNAEQKVQKNGEVVSKASVANPFDNSTNRHKKRTMIAILSLSLCFLLSTIFAMGSFGNFIFPNNQNVTEKLDINNLIANDINIGRVDDFYLSLIQKEEGFENKSIRYVKEINGFDGYQFLLVECEPSGYLIYDNALTTALESSPESQSPYKGYDSNNLYYGGPTEYYIKPEVQPRNGNAFYQHTVLDEQLDLNKAQQMEVEDYSKQITQNMEALVGRNELLRGYTDRAELKNSNTIKTANASKFNNEVSDDRCGYAAAAIIVYYYYTHKGWSQFLDGGEFDRGLVDKIQGTRPGPTWGPDLAAAMSDWSYNHGAKGTSLGLPYNTLPAKDIAIPSNARIFDTVKADRPAAILGNFPNPKTNSRGSSGSISHVVTVHKVQRWVNQILGITVGYSDYSFYCHYGWGTDYNNIQISQGVFMIGMVVSYDK